MEKVYEAAVIATMSVRKAAEEYSVSRLTLHEKVSRKVALQVTSSSKNYLTDDEEASLVGFLIDCVPMNWLC